MNKDDESQKQMMRSLKPLDRKSSDSELTSSTPLTTSTPRTDREQAVFNIAIKDDQLWSRLLLATSVLGILLILAAAVEILARGTTAIALSQGATGIVLNGIAILIYRPRQDARKRLDDIYNQMIEADNFEAATDLTETLEGDARDRVTEIIIDRLTIPKNRALRLNEQDLSEPKSSLKKSRRKRAKIVVKPPPKINLEDMLESTQENQLKEE